MTSDLETYFNSKSNCPLFLF